MKKITICISSILLTVVNSFGLYYGVPVTVPYDNINGVTVVNGETPFPTNAIFPVSIELRSLSYNYLKIVNNTIVERSTAEKAFTDLPAKYKKQVGGLWVEMTSEEKRIVDLPSKYKHPDGSEMTPEEKAAVDDAEEAARQDAKSLSLKKVENNFLLMCDQLSGTTTHKKLGFDAIKIIINSLPVEQQIIPSLQLLAIDAEAKREGGNLWWDDCTWHPDIVK